MVTLSVLVIVSVSSNNHFQEEKKSGFVDSRFVKPSDKHVRGHSTTIWTDFCHFLIPLSLRGQFLCPEHEEKQTFFDPLTPHLVHVVTY